MNKKIILAADHAGFELKEEIKKFLIKEGFEMEDKGAHSYNAKDDYTDFVFEAAKKVSADKNSRGIIFGASGQGEAIAANKVKGIRAALYYGQNMEIVKLSRTHNNANILSLGARFLKKEEAIKAIKLWLKTEFSNEERHIRRVKKISEI
jgi:ribose 5-phosphate isomerase B|tara:strand:+ start:5523 stop:5972 length:450 start_codon:yes stop_codon:yes gene_type:complete